MEYSKIKDLISTIDKSSIADFELKTDDVYIRMNKHNKENYETSQIRKESHTIEKASLTVPSSEEISEPITIIPEDKIDIKEGNIVVSPMVGTFFNSPSPKKPPYVKVGDKVKKGDILCIIEAMKIMNEISSRFDGEIAEILVDNEDMVEYNQPLFRIV